MAAPESAYLVVFSRDAFVGAGETLKYVAVDASTFVAVEDWAFENVPEGFSVATIEKSYYRFADYGPIDVTL